LRTRAKSVPTRWQIVCDGERVGDYTSAKGRVLKVSDLVNLPPPFPNGRVWRMLVVEACDGYDGKLVVEAADER
jgi:hypothetical protein